MQNYIRFFEEKKIITRTQFNEIVSGNDLPEHFNNPQHANTIRGRCFEVMCKLVLQRTYSRVYLWGELPYSLIRSMEKTMQLSHFPIGDMGIDIMADMIGVQCKWSKHQSYKGVDNLVNAIDKLGLERGIFFTNKEFKSRHHYFYKNIEYKHLPEDLTFEKYEMPKTQLQLKYTLHDYQLMAVEKMMKHHLGQIIMATGTGKSFVIAEFCKRIGGRIIIFVPSLQLIKQMKQSFPHLNIMEITGKINVDTIQKMMQLPQYVIICTYQSGQKLLNEQLMDITLIFDEAHRSTSTKYGAITHLPSKRKYYFTATKHKMDDNRYGRVLFSYDFQQAIQDKRICDFEIIVPEMNVDIKTNHPQMQYALTVIQLVKLFEMNMITKVLVYFNKISHAREFAKILNYCLMDRKLFNNDFCTNGDDDNNDINVYALSGEDHMDYRLRAIEEFTTCRRAVICSARIFNEGINIPCVDAVCFVDPRHSKIDVIQCIGRGLRLSSNKKNCKVIMPTLGNFNVSLVYEKIRDEIYGGCEKLLKSKIKVINLNKPPESDSSVVDLITDNIDNVILRFYSGFCHNCKKFGETLDVLYCYECKPMIDRFLNKSNDIDVCSREELQKCITLPNEGVAFFDRSHAEVMNELIGLMSNFREEYSNLKTQYNKSLIDKCFNENDYLPFVDRIVQQRTRLENLLKKYESSKIGYYLKNFKFENESQLGIESHIEYVIEKYVQNGKEWPHMDKLVKYYENEGWMDRAELILSMQDRGVYKLQELKKISCIIYFTMQFEKHMDLFKK